MSNSIERVETPSGATHKTPKGTYMKHAAGAWFEWLHEWVKVDSGVHVNVNQLTEISGDWMNLKKLTQAVFQGLPKEYRWAAYDITGDCYAYKIKPKQDYGVSQWDVVDRANNAKLVGEWCLDLDEETGHWLHSLIERQNVPTAADIDWSKAPEGTTHWHVGEWIRWTSKKDMNLWTLDAWDDGCRWTESAYGWHGTLEGFLADGAIKRPESIADVVRSIEAARVAEQSERTYPHYFKDVSAVDAIDLYHVARLYDITDPALFHAFKKIACAGKRGTKDRAQDVQEAIDALKRWQELSV